MEVSINGLRKHLIANYNSLVKRLNQNNENGVVTLEDYEIHRDLDSIRNGLVTLAFMYKEGEFDAMPDETHFEIFNQVENE